MKFYYERENGDEFEYSVDESELRHALRVVMAQVYKGAVGENLEIAKKVANQIVEELYDSDCLGEVYYEDLREYFRDRAFEYDCNGDD